MSTDGNLNCGFDSADGEKVQISGYVSELWDLVIIWVWGIMKGKD